MESDGRRTGERTRAEDSGRKHEGESEEKVGDRGREKEKKARIRNGRKVTVMVKGRGAGLRKGRSPANSRTKTNQKKILNRTKIDGRNRAREKERPTA